MIVHVKASSPLKLSKSKGYHVAEVINSQHGTTYRIGKNTYPARHFFVKEASTSSDKPKPSPFKEVRSNESRLLEWLKANQTAPAYSMFGFMKLEGMI